MLESLKNSPFFKGRTVAGIYLIILPDGSQSFDIVILKRNKSLINVEKTSLSINDIDELNACLPASVPVCLSLSGKGIVHKKIKAEKSGDDFYYLNKVLPNASTDEFYIQKTELTDDFYYISVIRKEIIDEIISNINSKGIFIVDVVIGPFAIKNIIPFLDQQAKNIYTKNFELTINDFYIENINRIEINSKNENYKLSEENITSELIIPFATGFNYFIPDIKQFKSIIPSVSELKNDFFYKQFIRIFGYGILIFFLVLLMVNYFVFTNYNQKYNELSYNYSQNEELIEKLNQLKQDIKLKESFVYQLRMIEPSRISFCADRIAYLLPKEIILVQINIHPLKRKLKKYKEPEFSNEIIQISGKCRKSTVLHEWIKMLKSEKWVKEIEILNVSQENKYSFGEFTIKITVTNIDSI
ncbi:MAG: hypothetical protein KAT68_02935 [Bacteroidales bacterium]|nr:hypothetical protein [Bacteroidales bacterium]